MIFSCSTLTFQYHELSPSPYSSTPLLLLTLLSKKVQFSPKRPFRLILWPPKTNPPTLKISLPIHKKHTLLVHVICWPPDYSIITHCCLITTPLTHPAHPGCLLDHSFFLPKWLLSSWMISMPIQNSPIPFPNHQQSLQCQRAWSFPLLP